MECVKMQRFGFCPYIHKLWSKNDKYDTNFKDSSQGDEDDSDVDENYFEGDDADDGDNDYASNDERRSEVSKGLRSSRYSKPIHSDSFHPYKVQLCLDYDRKGACEKGEDCSFAHGVEDLRGYGRKHYKTELCDQWAKGQKCSRNKERCFFAHGFMELRVPPNDGDDDDKKNDNNDNCYNYNNVKNNDIRKSPVEIDSKSGKYCAICDVDMDHVGQMPTHIDGEKHRTYRKEIEALNVSCLYSRCPLCELDVLNVNAVTHIISKLHLGKLKKNRVEHLEIQESTDQGTKPLTDRYCIICDVNVAGLAHMMTHIESDKHRMNLAHIGISQRLNRKFCSICHLNILDVHKATHGVSKVHMKNESLRCNICKIMVPSATHMRQHVKGKQHCLLLGETETLESAGGVCSSFTTRSQRSTPSPQNLRVTLNSNRGDGVEVDTNVKDSSQYDEDDSDMDENYFEGNDADRDKDYASNDERHSEVSEGLRSASTYKIHLCREYDKKGACEKGEDCKFAHGVEDLRGYGKKYLKTKLCNNWGKRGKCRRNKESCFFAHGKTDLRVPPNNGDDDNKNKNDDCYKYSNVKNNDIRESNNDDNAILEQCPHAKNGKCPEIDSGQMCFYTHAPCPYLNGVGTCSRKERGVRCFYGHPIWSHERKDGSTKNELNRKRNLHQQRDSLSPKRAKYESAHSKANLNAISEKLMKSPENIDSQSGKYCAICDVVVAQVEQMPAHIDGEKHRAYWNEIEALNASYLYRRCIICEIDILNVNAVTHIISKWHLRKFKKKHADYLEIQESTDKGTEPFEDRYCIICDKNVSTVVNMMTHIEGDKHQTNLANIGISQRFVRKFCSVCNLNILGVHGATHNLSKIHLKNENVKIETETSTEKFESAGGVRSSFTTRDVTNESLRRCDVCQIMVPTMTHMRQHVKGKHHRSLLAETETSTAKFESFTSPSPRSATSRQNLRMTLDSNRGDDESQSVDMKRLVEEKRSKLERAHSVEEIAQSPLGSDIGPSLADGPTAMSRSNPLDEAHEEKMALNESTYKTSTKRREYEKSSVGIKLEPEGCKQETPTAAHNRAISPPSSTAISIDYLEVSTRDRSPLAASLVETYFSQFGPLLWSLQAGNSSTVIFKLIDDSVYPLIMEFNHSVSGKSLTLQAMMNGGIPLGTALDVKDSSTKASGVTSKVQSATAVVDPNFLASLTPEQLARYVNSIG